MNTNHQRHSIRLQSYDYSQPGGYFVTLVTHEKEYLFGNIVGGKMKVNELGEIAEKEWLRTPFLRTEVELGNFVLMPNHFHAIVFINDSFVGAYGHTPLPEDIADIDGETELFRSPSKTVGALIRGFKGVVTKTINERRNSPSIPVWQRNYYEHIIRSERELNQIGEYIVSNPANWDSDSENAEIS